MIYKKGSGNENLTSADVCEEALCFGWIDSVPNKVDEFKFKLLVSPRKPNSVWSALNKRRVAKLIAEKQMTEAGLRKIEIAKKNGMWTQLESSDRLEFPKLLAQGLKANRKASNFFESIAPSSKRAILGWIGLAKTEETKLKRIKETIRLAAQGIRANHYQDLKKLKAKRR
ncbi:MAG: YdeI/OmpD-associated family protein [Bdellovibrionales bacterium]|nr:YdeI/OmpD-associated family protein [Bdellovibrionales bacterium]